MLHRCYVIHYGQSAMISPEIQNYWSSYSEPIWRVDIAFDFTRVGSERLLLWACEALRVLFDTEVYKITAVPSLNYYSVNGDPNSLCDLIFSRSKSEGVIDLLYLDVGIHAGDPSSDVYTLLNWDGGKAGVQGTSCKDLASLQMAANPGLNSQSDFVYHRKPLEISGALFCPNNPRFPSVNVRRNPSEIYIQLKSYTDIWFPKVRGMNEPDFDGVRWWSNSLLASHNGGRLNAALRNLHSLSTSIGGEWRVAHELRNDFCNFDELGMVVMD